MSSSPMNDPLAGYSERRDFYRMVTECEVTITLSNGLKAKGIVRNLSSNGVAFYCDAVLEKGQYVDLSISLMDEKAQPLSANGEVVRVESSRKHPNLPYEVACAIAVDYQ